MSGVATLGDIKPNENISWSGTDLQLLDDNGATAKLTDIPELGEVDALFWYLTDEYATEEMPVGWYLVNEDNQPIVEYPQNGREIPFGQAYLMVSGDSDLKITYSGSVAQTDYDRPLQGGYNFLGNASPVDQTLGDFTCENVSWSGTDLQLLDDNGATAMITDIPELGEVPALFWYLPDEYATEEMPVGWYLVNEDNQPIVEYPQNGRTIPSGQGFLMVSGDGGATVKIPSAL